MLNQALDIEILNSKIEKFIHIQATVALVSYPTRRSLLFIFGFLYGSSEQQRNIVQLCTTVALATGPLPSIIIELKLLTKKTNHDHNCSQTHNTTCHNHHPGMFLCIHQPPKPLHSIMNVRSEKIYARHSLMPTYVTSPFSLLEVVDNVNITVKPLHKWQTEDHTTLVDISTRPELKFVATATTGGRVNFLHYM